MRTKTKRHWQGVFIFMALAGVALPAPSVLANDALNSLNIPKLPDRTYEQWRHATAVRQKMERLGAPSVTLRDATELSKLAPAAGKMEVNKEQQQRWRPDLNKPETLPPLLAPQHESTAEKLAETEKRVAPHMETDISHHTPSRTVFDHVSNWYKDSIGWFSDDDAEVVTAALPPIPAEQVVEIPPTEPLPWLLPENANAKTAEADGGLPWMRDDSLKTNTPEATKPSPAPLDFMERGSEKFATLQPAAGEPGLLPLTPLPGAKLPAIAQPGAKPQAAEPTTPPAEPAPLPKLPEPAAPESATPLPKLPEPAAPKTAAPEPVAPETAATQPASPPAGANASAAPPVATPAVVKSEAVQPTEPPAVPPAIAAPQPAAPQPAAPQSAASEPTTPEPVAKKLVPAAPAPITEPAAPPATPEPVAEAPPVASEPAPAPVKPAPVIASDDDEGGIVVPAAVPAKSAKAQKDEDSIADAKRIFSTQADSSDDGRLSTSDKRAFKKIYGALPKQKADKPLTRFSIEHGSLETSVPVLDEEAVEAKGVKIAVKSPPRDIPRALNSAYELLVNGQIEAATVVYKDVLSTNPGNKTALLGLASAYQRMGDKDNARHIYAELLRHDPRNKEALTNFLTLASQDAPAETLQELDRLEARSPEFSVVPAQKALIYERQGRTEEAIQSMSRALKLAPDNLLYRYNLAIMLDKAKHYPEAAQIYRSLIKAGEEGQSLPTTPEKLQQRLTFIMSNQSMGKN